MVLQLLKMTEEITMTKFMDDQKYISLYVCCEFLKGGGNSDKAVNAALAIRWNCRLLYLFLASHAI